MEWVESAAGATGGGTDKIFWENGQTVTTNYTITNGYNAMSAGPVTINNSVAVTIGTGEKLDNRINYAYNNKRYTRTGISNVYTAWWFTRR